MGQKIVVGPINRGLRTDVTAFNVDNDSFPTLINAYQWRGRVKRKRGTSLLNRLKRFFDSSSTSYSSTSSINLVAGAANVLTGFSLQTNGNIVPGSVTIVDTTAGNTYTDPGLDGILVGAPAGSGTINYSTGAVTISGGAGNTITAVFNYYPDLPVMGLRDLILTVNQSPGNIGFDTKYSYNILNTDPYDIYDVSFYKNPSTATYPGYTQKTSWTPTTWNGQDYQQFWTVNFQGALWATNGITVPFNATNVGMQFKAITGVTTIAAGPPAIADLTIVAHGLVQGDFVFVNEVVGITGINFQTGYVVSADPQAANTVRVEFPNATIGLGPYTSGGIAQYLTNRSDATKDCIRWYDGDPTNGDPDNPTLNGINGWVNFAPPLSQLSYSIADNTAAQYYLSGARMIVAFKDRLLFIGPVIETSGGSKLYLQDTVIFSQNGTPYYTASFTGDASLATTVFTPILTPANQVATPTAYWEDVTGFGGFISAGIDQPINTAATNGDMLILGLRTTQTRLAYTGNDILPFNFFEINSELGSGSTFSSVTFDKGVLSIGSRGLITTNQSSCQRIDTEIPDQIFEINLLNNGPERICSQRDFITEWVYFTYTSNLNSSSIYKFPNQTLQYNYRDQSWSINKECYTTYGIFRKRTGFTWSTVGRIYPTWSSWNDPWSDGESTLLTPQVMAGNQQGFVIIRDVGTNEANSLYIRDISGSTVTSPDHGLNSGDFITISGALGSVGAEVNGKIFSVGQPITQNAFVLNPTITSGTYVGGGVIKRMYVPYIQTKQFPAAWGMGRKTRLGAQQYLFTKTSGAQIQLLIFLSQDGTNPYNDGGVVPDVSENGSLIYSTVLYTCPESTNLGLTPSNINLNSVTSEQQEQIWHRINTSLVGDTVQIGFTLSPSQMRALDIAGEPIEITNATQANPCVLTCSSDFSAGLLIKIDGITGMTQLNGNIYNVISVTPTTVTIEVDSTAFDAYVSDGTATLVSPINQFAEIELHGMILDCSPSMVLA